MADGEYRMAVVTPEERLVDVRARSVVLRSSDGELTVLDGHTPLVTDVTPGEVRIEVDEGDVVHLAVHGGYLQVETGPGLDAEDAAAPPGGGTAASTRTTRVTLLAGVAELADQIDVPRAERARTEARARLEELRAATGRSGIAGVPEGDEAPTTPEALELAQVEAALLRAEVRLEAAGANA
jgi:F-type H+-transporting ATPase subunit epsilon